MRHYYKFLFSADSTPYVKIYDPEFNQETKIDQIPSNNLSTYTYRFTPRKAGKYVICPTVGKTAVTDTPVSIEVAKPVDFTKLHVYGSGVGSTVRTGQNTVFTVDTRDIACKKLEVEVNDQHGEPVDVELSQENNGSPYRVNYTPKNSGVYKVKIFVDGELAFDVQVDVTEPLRKCK